MMNLLSAVLLITGMSDLWSVQAAKLPVTIRSGGSTLAASVYKVS